MNKLQQAAEYGRRAKQAIKDDHLDQAWQLLQAQKQIYAAYTTQSQQLKDEIILLDADIHKDMAIIMTRKNNHLSALTHFSYVYKINFNFSPSIITPLWDFDLNTYFEEAYLNHDFNMFARHLKVLLKSDFQSVFMYVEKYFPQLPNVDDYYVDEDSVPIFDEPDSSIPTETKSNPEIKQPLTTLKNDSARITAEPDKPVVDDIFEYTHKDKEPDLIDLILNKDTLTGLSIKAWTFWTSVCAAILAVIAWLMDLF